MISTFGIAAHDAASPLAPWRFERRDVGAHDVHIQILFCGICHSDLHTVRGEWGPCPYPQVPGHEIVGRVVSVGADVTSWKAGDLVGVGCMVDSCQHCQPCADGLEQYCDNGMTGTYGGTEKETGRPTQGGYSTGIVVNEKFVLRVPANLDLAGVAPLLCAGITTWSPLRQWKAGPGSRVGVVGIGGLGHMAVKLAAALGAHVVVLTTSPSKAEDARRLGAHEVVVSRDAAAMKALRNSLDLIIDTVGTPHDIDAEMQLLRLDGTLVLLGGSPQPHPAPGAFTFIMKRRRLAGSLIGGIAETQEMLDFCGQHGITADIELIKADAVNEAYERMLKSDVKYRFVIDLATLAEPV
ncbi:NAD(P)-dependent alcohol dehydrogenase [Gemmatimonas phototrophica]|uniref:Hydroxyacid dehydrogenase n=1 Tax=Gemmatimonas phototrophica TaxID=1379270 RepID=A0A143BN46_9BACT|nr:NAD(P)-dependent alcohol dehydrogenase [Gemmatimonas phototrophica]AMW05881.1 hydroxyacid dehydrogenase [Gemmatimonas phototrophica]